MDKPTETTHIETRSSPKDDLQPKVMGNVQLLQGNETVLVPTPSPDPNGEPATDERFDTPANKARQTLSICHHGENGRFLSWSRHTVALQSSSPQDWVPYSLTSWPLTPDKS